MEPEKILKVTIAKDFDKDIKGLNFSNHSLAKEDGQLTIRLQVPYNYSEIDKFELRAIELLGIDKNWIKDISLDNSNCTHNLNK